MSLQQAATDLSIWTHDHVLDRIGAGLKAVILSSARPGPQSFSAPWPSTFREPPPLAELDQWLELRREFESAIHARNERPSAVEIALADEALAWPARYLADPLQRDAVWLTARCVGLGHKLETILRQRRKVADFMVQQRKENGAPDVIRIYEDDAEDAAAKVVAWANKAIADGPQRRRARRAHPQRGAHPVRARDPQGESGRAPHLRPPLRRDAGKTVQPEPRSSSPHRGRRGNHGGLAADGVKVR